MQMEERKAATDAPSPANASSSSSSNFYQGMHPYQQAQLMRRQPSCPICGSQSLPPNMVLEPCQHQFHFHCVEGYIQNEKTCPVCRTPIQRHQGINRSFPTMATQGHPHEYPMPLHSQGQSAMPMGRQSYAPPQMHAMPPTNGGSYNGQAPIGHFPSASVYELPPEVFLDTSYEQQGSNAPGKMRKGKWTAEEALYCDRLIEEFKLGNLPLAEGTTLRTFLSKLLNCDPMRISKKYTGNQCIGKIIFRKKAKEPSKDEVENTRKQLAELERVYLERERMNQQRREKRLETELTRDRGRLLTTRPIYHSMPGQAPPSMGQGPPPTAPPPGYHHHPGMQHPMQQQPQHMQPAYPHHHHSNNNNNSNNNSNSGASKTNGQDAEKSQTGSRHVSPQQHDPSPRHTSPHDTSPSSRVKTEPTSTEHKDDEAEDAKHHADNFPRVSSIDSFSSLFPRIASLDCFQGLQSMSRNPSSMSLSNHGDAGMFRSPSLECFNGIPRVNSLEQFSNFIASMPPAEASKKETPVDHPFAEPAPKGKPPMSGIARAASSDKLHTSSMTSSSTMSLPRVPSLDKALDKMPRVPSMDRLHGSGIPRVPSLGGLPRINSTEAFLQHIPSLSNLSGLMPSFGSFDKLSSLSNPTKHLAIPRNSSLEDILSLVAASADHENNPRHLKRKAAESSEPLVGGIHKSKLPMNASDGLSTTSSSLSEKKQRL
ncbi:hypothetical protein SPRG_02979 [Saprolegnia parasitica CBS 223.65]|uniref:RING-type domain-containing protein n=1 Tax=Saprolegnia parasitica (strain CBS 223.65) TaxID=695850 RepID=A0A067D0B6_SAPPC|nr:hypothetical protein SPRG_02979 [Saprolegnia parasitica CBS 223.65]KDO32502.1 hypothetical protein SPRG_02979 [Saprolegnia parasitica CBS 223.65]|eukprot:XP_012196951.1 hypothetical protein SPRG_02979 [Saprolegnia parasitica CBS 223.65]